MPYFMGKTLFMPKLAEVLQQARFSLVQRRHTMHAPRVVALRL
jgi:hypothetical protein